MRLVRERLFKQNLTDGTDGVFSIHFMADSLDFWLLEQYLLEQLDFLVGRCQKLI